MRERHLIRGSCLVSVLAALLLGGVLGSVDIAAAVDSGPTVTAPNGLCMQRIFAGSDAAPITSTNALNCTAEDIKISAVTASACVGGACDGPNACIEGLDFDLSATFGLSVTSNERYDASFFFRTDGTSIITTVKGKPQESGAYGGTQNNIDGSGECSLSWLTAGVGPALNLDGGDACGDLNSGTPSVSFTIPSVKCSSTANDGFVHLPYCTSWHSGQSTVCGAVDVVNPTSDADRFTHAPDTKSKCTCGDLKLNIQIRNPDATVTKTATRADVTYSVSVENKSGFAVDITDLNDTAYGDITQTSTDIISTDCILKTGLADKATYSCKFTVKHLAHDPPLADDVSNTIRVKIHDSVSGKDVTRQGSTRVIINLNAAP